MLLAIFYALKSSETVAVVFRFVIVFSASYVNVYYYN